MQFHVWFFKLLLREVDQIEHGGYFIIAFIVMVTNVGSHFKESFRYKANIAGQTQSEGPMGQVA